MITELVPIGKNFFVPHRQCAECPFKYGSARGWFGPYPPSTYLEAAHDEHVVVCHMTAKSGDAAKLRHCTGASLFRRNIFKEPRSRVQQQHQDKCVEKYSTNGVFKTTAQFLQHHTGPGSINYLEDEE